jgi:hypothetical protein
MADRTSGAVVARGVSTLTGSGIRFGSGITESSEALNVSKNL